MSVAYESFLPYVLPLVPNAPEPSAVIAVRNACIDFARGSLLLQQALDPIPTAAGVADYDIDTPSNTVLAHVVTLFYRGQLLPKRSVGEMSARFGRDWQLLTGTPQAYFQTQPGVVTLVYTPDTSVTDALTGLIAVTPSRASSVVDDRFLEVYAEQIAHGAASKLCAIPNQPFTDADAALLYGKLFRADVANARAHASAGQTRAPLVVRFKRS